MRGRTRVGLSVVSFGVLMGEAQLFLPYLLLVREGLLVWLSQVRGETDLARVGELSSH